MIKNTKIRVEIEFVETDEPIQNDPLISKSKKWFEKKLSLSLLHR